MHVITKSALQDFWRVHPDAERPLRDWFRLMDQGHFADFAELRAVFASADIVGKLTVFNIGGNKYRLIAAVHYDGGKVFIREVLTHADYDRNDWKRRN
jgi:mRNA interferase HigB